MLHRSSAALAFVALLFAGCRDEALTRTDTGFSVAPAQVEFGNVFVAHPRHAAVTLTNRSRAAMTVSASVGAPFSLEAATLELPAGASVDVDLTASPQSEGALQGTLLLEAEGQTLEVALTGVALLPPVCSAPTTCFSTEFNPDLGVCTSAPLPDGTGCGDAAACVTNGECHGGVCLGTAVTCDDQNPCTVDACQPGKGCLHIQDPSTACPAPASLCQAAFCDPLTGCGVRPVVDGTPCGSADCSVANVCLAGACQQVTPPDGAECAAASPCQGKGTCQAKVCVQGPALPLEPVWSYSAGGRELRFDGVADAQDNLYWVECPTSSSCEVVSATRDGLERWRTPMVLVRGSPQPPFQQFIAGTKLLTLVGQDTIEARELDGRLLWTADLLAAFGAQMFDADVPLNQRGVFFRGASATPQGEVYVPLEARRINTTQTGGTHSLLVALNAATGTTRWTRVLTGEFAETALDQQGNLYLSKNIRQQATQFEWELHAYSPSGALRWFWPVMEGRSPAVSAGHLVTGGYASFDTSTGAELWRKPHSPVNSAALSGGSAWAMAFRSQDLSYDVVRRDAATGAEDWVVNVGLQTFLSELTLTGEDSALLLEHHLGGFTAPYGLLELDERGRQTFSCNLPVTVSFAWRMTLLKDRVVVLTFDSLGWRLLAFDLPGRQLGTSGWVTERGSNTRSAAAR